VCAQTEKPKLGYWNIRGLGASLRYMLHYCEVDFEDVTYAIGPAPENNKDAWFGVKHSLGIDFPNLPYFIDGDYSISENHAIHKYIARKWNPELLGKTAEEFGNAEMMSAFCQKFKWDGHTMPSYTGGEHKDEITCQKLYEDNIEHLEKICGFRNKHNYKWLCGENLMWIDFFFFESVDYMKWLTNGYVFNKFPELEDYHKRFILTIEDIW